MRRPRARSGIAPRIAHIDDGAIGVVTFDDDRVADAAVASVLLEPAAGLPEPTGASRSPTAVGAGPVTSRTTAVNGR